MSLADAPLVPPERVAAAPISWGVCEVPGWGVTLPPERVLGDMHDLGLRATELGPDCYLPTDPRELRQLLGLYDLRLLAGFVPAVLHRPEERAASLATVAAVARRLSALGAEVLVLAAVSGGDGYDSRPEPGPDGWASIVDGLAAITALADDEGLALAVHPHAGTVIETRAEVETLLERCDAGLCVDSGHLLLGGADPVDIVRQAGDRVRHVHLKDVDGTLVDAVRAGEIDYMAAVRHGLFRPLGQGDAPVRAMIGQLEQADYRHWYVLEQDVALGDPAPGTTGSDPARDVAASLEFLHIPAATRKRG